MQKYAGKNKSPPLAFLQAIAGALIYPAVAILYYLLLGFRVRGVAPVSVGNHTMFTMGKK
jgi:hypothetical protein